MGEPATEGGSPPGVSTPELPALGAEQHRILAYASAIGPEFDFSLLVAAMGADEETLAEQLEQLVRLGVLRERSGGERFGFAEEAVRAALYRSLTESRLRVLHRKIAEVEERGSPSPSPAMLAELGRHYFLGKVPAKSYEYNRRAAEIARDSGDPGTAIHHFERVLVDLTALGGDRRRERAEIAESLGDLSYSTSHFRLADRYFEEALENVDHDQPRIRARLLLARAEIAREDLDLDRATHGAGQALLLFETEEDPIGMAQTYRLLGRIAFQRGRYSDALDESMRALEIFPPGADPRFLGRLSIDIGNAFALLGEAVRSIAIEWYERAVDRLRTVGDWAELARALHNLGTTVGETQPEDGLEHLERAREAAERAHDARAVGRTFLSGVEMRLTLGQLEEAERDNEQAGRLLEHLADTLGTEEVMMNRGRVAEKRGQWDEAEKAYSSSAEMARRYQLPADEADAQFYLARLRFKTRNLEGARVAFARATELKVTELSPRLAPAYVELRRQLELEGPAALPGPRPESDPVESVGAGGDTHP